MTPSPGPDAMCIGQARLTAGLDRIQRKQYIPSWPASTSRLVSTFHGARGDRPVPHLPSNAQPILRREDQAR